MKLTEKQEKAFRRILEIVQEKNLDQKHVELSDFYLIFQEEKKHKFPWKKAEDHKNEDGSYDFSKIFSGIAPAERKTVMPVEILDSGEDSEDIDIGDHLKKSIIPEHSKHSDNEFNNPVFLVESIDSTGESHVIGITQTFQGAWDQKYKAIHDNGIMTKKEVFEKLSNDGFVYIQSRVSRNLFCKISKWELMP